MTTYTILIADVATWAARSDLSVPIPTMVALFEARCNRALRVRQMETSFTGTIASNVIALPTGWLEFKRLWPDSYPKCTLLPQTMEVVREETDGVPTFYATDGTNVRFNGTGDITGVYYKAIPSLQTNETNWLCTAAYDAYLFGVLAEAADYRKDDAEMTKYFARSGAILDDIQAADRRLTGPLVSRKAA